jgi:Spy/CpxP family protein refolding chaperone
MSELSATRKAGLWVGLVFLLGAALGGVGGYSYEHHRVSAASAPLPEPVRRARRVEQLTQSLNLTSAQRQQVDAILLERHTESKTLHDQTDAQIERVHQAGRNQIRAILTPEQKPKFEEFLRNLDEQRKHNGPK